MQNIILPIGTSGSEKSTWIKSFIKNTNEYIVISPDEMRIEFTGNINDKSKDDLIYEIINIIVPNIIWKQKKSVIIDATNLQKERRRNFINKMNFLFPNICIKYKLFELNPELAKSRIKNDIESGIKRANVSDATIERHALLYKEMLNDILEEPITELK